MSNETQTSTGTQPSTQSSGQTGVRVVGDVPDCTPFTLNSAFISLEVPQDVFILDVGGTSGG
jgi:hypothetical protein